MRPIQLLAREYKLLLKLPADTSDDGSRGALKNAKAARAFWSDRLVPVLETQASTGLREFAHSGVLTKSGKRSIQFWDTEAGTFSSAGLSLRWRKAQAGKKQSERKGELTLKLRTPDLFTAAAAELRRKIKSAKTKLEEDIAPLAISHSDGGTRHACFASPPSMRSRFSLSMTVPLDKCPRQAKDLLALFPSLPRLMAHDQAGGSFASQTLIAGPQISETTFKGTTVKFGDGFSGEFTLTAWELDTRPRRFVSEISYRCKLSDGAITLAASRRAGALFIALQNELADIVHPQVTSKTAIAIPRRVGSP